MRVKRFQYLLVLLGLAAFLQVKAQTWTLRRIEDSVLVRNAGLHRYSSLIQAQQYEAEASNSWPAPQLGLGLSEFPYAAAKPGMGSNGPRKMPMLRLEQQFPNRAMNRAASDMASSGGQTLRDVRSTLRFELLRQAREAFSDAGIAMFKLALLAQQKAQLDLMLNLIKGRLALHTAGTSDLYQAEARLSDLKIEALRLRLRIGQNEALLNGLMNRSADAPLPVDTSGLLNLQLPSLVQVVNADSLLQHHSQLRRLSDEKATLQAQQAWQLAQAKPIWGLRWDNMRMYNGMYMFNAMAMVSLPIVSWHSRQYRDKAAAIGLQQLAVGAELQNEQWNLQSRISKDLIRWQSDQAEVQEFITRTLPAFQQTYQSRLQDLSEGTGSVFETLMAWEELTASQEKYYDTWSEWLHADIELHYDGQVP